jgi:lipopolysaccharide transport system permease protein
MKTSDWDLIIKPKSTFFSVNLKELWLYKDLIFLMVKRDITALYKQTILGPLWMFIQPIFTTLIYTFTFGQANLSTDEIPSLLFYLIGQTFWNYFSECLNKTSTTFIANASVFGKVYFPRLVMPLSVIISNLLKLSIQLILMFLVFTYFCVTTNSLQIQWPYLILIPFFILLLGIFSLSLGLLFSSLTTKYRDFSFLLTFAVQLLMFLSCVVFPASMFKGFTQQIMLCNPVASSLEAIKYSLTGHGIFSINHILFGIALSGVLLLLSIFIFNRTEKSFMDTV